jgi:hypothetical protein
MITRTRRCALFIGAAIAAMAAGAESPANRSAVGVSTIAQQPKCSSFVRPASQFNQYALLLFFKNDENNDSRIRAALGFRSGNHTDASGKPTMGCIENPEYNAQLAPAQSPAASNPQYLIVQGGCPTDCKHSQPDRGVDRKYVIGDPLQYEQSDIPNLLEPGKHDTASSKIPDWGIYFADPSPETYSEIGAADGATIFSVYQIFARDSCHAGKILRSLKVQMPQLFNKYYLGQLMIGINHPSSYPTARYDPPHDKVGDCARRP